MATSTYDESGTTANEKTGWILDMINPGKRYMEPVDTTVTDKIDSRAHHIIKRHRFLKGNIVYAHQEGQVGVGSEVGGKISGAVGDNIGPSGTRGYLCTDDSLSIVETGSGMMRQDQTWEHFGDIVEYTVSDLAE